MVTWSEAPSFRRAYNNGYYKKRRAEFFAGKKCKKCGATTQLYLCGVKQGRGEHRTNTAFFTSNKDRQKKMFKETKGTILCSTCRYPSRLLSPKERDARQRLAYNLRRRAVRVQKKVSLHTKVLVAAKKRGII